MKSISTDPVYQSTFLPKIAKAEIQIKKLIVYYFLYFKSKDELKNRITAILKELHKTLPANVLNKESYIDGLRFKAEKLIREQFDKQVGAFLIATANVKSILYTKGERVPVITTPIDLQRVVAKYPYSMWEQAKGTPYIANYPNVVKKYIKEVADESITADAYGSNISIWQKAELDIRHDRQLKMLDEVKSSGIRYYWISSHANCSKRCERWQGKLYDVIAQHSETSGHRMKEKVDGNTVYCLEEIIHLHQYGKNGKDYGENSIINGYNCRHYLIPYTSNSKSPKEYSKEDVKQQREIETYIREQERSIRQKKNEFATLRLDPLKKKEALELKREINKDLSQLHAYCKKKGYAFEEWRTIGY